MKATPNTTPTMTREDRKELRSLGTQLRKIQREMNRAEREMERDIVSIENSAVREIRATKRHYTKFIRGSSKAIAAIAKRQDILSGRLS
jgi:phage host-nuclease inhibitor protein Gam